MIEKMPEGTGVFDPFFVPEDWARLQYGRMLWKVDATRDRLLNHWSDARHPYHERFESSYRGFVIRLLESHADDNDELDREFREAGESLRSVMREIPPVFGSFW